METFGKKQNYYKDTLVVKHHKIKYSSKMPLWVIVELMSFSNMSKLYISMYYSKKDAIFSMVGVGKDTEDTIYCILYYIGKWHLYLGYKYKLLLMIYWVFDKIKRDIVFFCTKEHEKREKQWVILF